MAEKIKIGVRKWLDITPAQPTVFQIQETMSYEATLVRNRIWYNGDPDELSQLYAQMGSTGSAQNKYRFWAAVSSPGREIRKIHTGLPGIKVDVLTDIVMTDFNGITVPDNKKDVWDEICKENNFKDMLDTAVRECLYMGDGAFKISIDQDVSDYPIVEWYPADRIDIIAERSRLKEVVFKTSYSHNRREYMLCEHYGMGYITYNLFDQTRRQEVTLNTIPQTEGLEAVQYKGAGKFCMAVPMRFFKNPKQKERGKSIYDGKTDDYDALDEAWSQWIQALRDGRSKTYIPEDMLPRNKETGVPIPPNAFDNQYIKIDGGMGEDGKNRIDVEQPEIPHDSYMTTYITALDLCLQGCISPSTLGIDVKKLDNGEAQREKEKTTLYTRGKMIDALQDTIPILVDTIFKAINVMSEQTPEDVVATIGFGEYANPSFESQVETVGKAKQQGIMSNEAAVEELYGDTKDQDWKDGEIARLNARDGVEIMEEPGVNTNGLEMIDDESENSKEGISDVEKEISGFAGNSKRAGT